MIKSDDLYLISLLDREKSIAGAAKYMHLTPSAVSQRLSNLEIRLNVTLAERAGRSGILLTPDGKFLANKIKPGSPEKKEAGISATVPPV